MKRTFLASDLFWLGIGAAFCWGGLSLGFGSFRQPQTGFMPVLAGLALALLAAIDLIGSLLSGWGNERPDREVWAEINAGKLLLTLVALLVYTLLLNTLGFSLATIPLLVFLFRLMQPRAWWIVVAAAVAVTGLFYFGFKIGLDCQLPAGPFGF